MDLPEPSLDWPVRMLQQWLEAYSQDSLDSVTIRTAGGKEIVLYPPAARADASDNGRLSPLEKAILAVAGREPKTAKKLASSCNRPYNSEFRKALASLCRIRPIILAHTPDGYHLSSQMSAQE